jgi:hypothetical protein
MAGDKGRDLFDETDAIGTDGGENEMVGVWHDLTLINSFKQIKSFKPFPEVTTNGAMGFGHSDN